MSPEHPEIPKVGELTGEEEHGHADNHGRLIAVATVLTTLAAALVAFAQGSALATHDQADARAERYGALALNASAGRQDQAQVQLDRFDLLQRQQRAADVADLFDTYGSGSKATKLTAARWTHVANQTLIDTRQIAASQNLPYICSPSRDKSCRGEDALYSPEKDRAFPDRYTASAQRSSYRLAALRDAANEQADGAEAHFVHYAACLTMLAVAVFLFGYSLTPQGRARRKLFSRVAAGFVAVASIWALVEAVQPVHEPPAAAADAFADGEVARNASEDGVAVRQYDRALALRPRFVEAYDHRAQAEYALGVPHTTNDSITLPTIAGGLSVPRTATLDRVIADDRAAIANGSDSPTVLAELGSTLLYRGLIGHDDADLEESRDLSLEAEHRLREQSHAADELLGSYFDVAEATLALGRPATAEYAAAENQMARSGSDPESGVAGALTDLSLIERTRPDMASRARGFASQVVARAGRVQPYATTPHGFAPGASSHTVTFKNVSLSPDPGHALFTIGDPGSLDLDRDVVSAQWQYRDPLHGEWVVLPEISGTIGKGGLIPDGNGYDSDNPSYVSGTTPTTCLPPGQYRLDLYVDGRPAGHATTNGDWPALEASKFREIDAALCAPHNWVPLPTREPGADGFFAPDAKSGIVVFTIPTEAIGADLSGNRPALADIAGKVVTGFGSGLLPALRPAGRPQPTNFFMNFKDGQYQRWSYRGGTVLSGVGTSASGQIFIGVTFGPPNGDQEALFLSLSQL